MNNGKLRIQNERTKFMNRRGLIHIYYGYGKGKTTAALGLVLRACGYDMKVVIVQFLKEMRTGELISLENLPNVTVFRGAATAEFTNTMSKDEKDRTTNIHNNNLEKALKLVDEDQCDLLVLDEVLDAYQMGMVDEKLFERIVLNKPKGLELVITGHKKTDWVMKKGDYITEMVSVKHPYSKGIRARKGIEF